MTFRQEGLWSLYRVIGALGHRRIATQERFTAEDAENKP
jgi:hypothetical protein